MKDRRRKKEKLSMEREDEERGDDWHRTSALSRQHDKT